MKKIVFLFFVRPKFYLTSTEMNNQLNEALLDPAESVQLNGTLLSE